MDHHRDNNNSTMTTLSRCTGLNASCKDCGTCDSCILNNKITFAKEWFTRLSENAKQKFLRKLLNTCCDSVELMGSLIEHLKPLQSKDFTYSRSKASAVFNFEMSNTTQNLENPIGHSELLKYASLDREWFESATPWSRLNYLLRIFQYCNSYTLDSMRHTMHKRYEKARRANARNSSLSSKRHSGRSNEYIHGFMGEIDVDSASLHQNERHSALWSSHQEQFGKHTRSTVTFSPILQEYSIENPSVIDEAFELKSTEISISPLSSSHHLRQHRGQSSRLSARCYPYTVQPRDSRYSKSSENSDSDDYLSLDDDTTETSGSQSGLFRTVYRILPKHRDFIRRLPVHLSKRILGFLDTSSLVNCVCVSKHWRILAEEVRNETLTQQIMREDVMLIQGSTETIPNPLYARIVPLHVPKLSESGEIIINNQARHVDVTSEDAEFENTDMQYCYDGIETIVVHAEERHIYCGAYNVLILNQSKDNCRVTYYNGGNFVPVASMDRRIRLLDVKSGRCEKTITEHVGSVKSVCTDESRGFVISGSYDTTIRLWDIKSGRCQRIFLGHKSSVITLSLHGRYLASGSTDKTCKVWNMKSGKCIRTFRHRSIIQSVAVGENLLLTGCAAGKVRIWNFKAAKLVKSLDGHMGPITCARFDNNHIVTGSKDCYAMAWSAKGDFKRCLRTFRHPKEVNCLELMYCRIITGSADGKIRVWNLLNGECLRVIRGNSRNDPITSLYASEDRLVINTRSNLLLYNFEPIQWDYTCPTEKESEFIKHSTLSNGDQRIQNHAFNRAQLLRRKGSILIQSSHAIDSTVIAPSQQQSRSYQRSMRVQSAPSRPPIDSIQKHVSRIQSAASQRSIGSNVRVDSNEKKVVIENAKLKQGILKNNMKNALDNREGDRVDGLVYNAFEYDQLAYEISKLKTTELVKEITPNRNVSRVIARSRSAPAHRTRTLPADQCGYTSSSNVQIKLPENRLDSTKGQKESKKARPFSASTGILKNPTEVYSDLKLKSFYQQLDFETNLAQQHL